MNYFRCGGGRYTHTATKIDVAKTPLASFESNVSGLYIPEILAYIQATQSGTGDPSPSNPRAINGVSSVDTTRTGKNLANSDNVGDVIYNDQHQIRQGLVLTLAGTFTISIQNAYTTGKYIFVKKRNADGTLEGVNYLLQGTGVKPPITHTIEKGEALLIYTPDNKDTTQSIFDYTKLQIELGSTATAYEPYTGTTATTSLGGTYYGCELDVTNGVLRVTRGYYLANGSENFGMGTTSNFRYFDMHIGNPLNTNAWETDIISNIFLKQGMGCPYCQMNGEKKLRFVFSINDTSVTSVADLQALLTNTNAQVVYPLATPQTYQLTPAQIEQLLGQNNVFCSTGDVAVKYWKID